MTDSALNLYDALFDFRRARRRAVLSDVLSRLTGTHKDLLSFEEVRKIIKAQGSLERGLQNIPLEAIVGSVNRYQDFTRDFLPRKNVQAQRWAKVQILASGAAGFPPIEVYQVGKAYFVIDGNHRVSVARELGAKSIQAYVHEVPAQVELTPGDTLQDVLLKGEHAQFLEQTQLDQLRPGADIRLTEVGQYRILQEHIEVHRYFMGRDLGRPISKQEAVLHWYDTVYLPVVDIMRRQGLPHEFPQRSEADLYLWIAEHRAALEEELESPIDTSRVVSHLVKEHGKRSKRVITRLGERVAGALVPKALDGGPPPGEWRKEKLQVARPEASGIESAGEAEPGALPPGIFADILVPVSGTEVGWTALEQALVIADREKARLTGLHIVPGNQLKSAKALAIQERFKQRCEAAGIAGTLVLSPGPVASKIIERSRWNDLVVVNLAHPTKPSQLIKVSSGFRELVLRCPRPILVVPGKVSALSHAMLAYDGSPKAEEALFVATYLCGKWNIPLEVVSVIETGQNTDAIQQHAAHYLSSHGVNHRVSAIEGPIAQAILVIAEEVQCDWIIMGGYGEPPLVNLLLDTIVDKVLRSSHRPMLLCR